MIHGFEEVTQSLSEKERAIAEDIGRGLRLRIGEEQAITSTQIIDSYQAKRGVKLSGPRLRKIINYLRVTKRVKNLVASEKGYYVETDPQKIEAYRQGLQSRIDAMIAVIESYTIENSTHYDDNNEM